jgi:purine-binding chemotaxis protein CheW
VAEVIRISATEIQPSPAIVQGNAAQDCITGVINHGERLLIVLDLNRLFSDEEKAVFETLE